MAFMIRSIIKETPMPTNAEIGSRLVMGLLAFLVVLMGRDMVLGYVGVASEEVFRFTPVGVFGLLLLVVVMLMVLWPDISPYSQILRT